MTATQNARFAGQTGKGTLTSLSVGKYCFGSSQSDFRISGRILYGHMIKCQKNDEPMEILTSVVYGRCDLRFMVLT